MSNTGLHSGMYERMRKFAQLVDDVIVTLSTGNIDQDEKVKELGCVLKSIGNQKKLDLSAQVLSAILQEKSGLTQSKWQLRWQDLGERLLNNEINQDQFDQLEILAQAVEQERSSAHARMRGNQ